MAIGDLDGDMQSTYDARQRLKKSSGLDGISVGPIGRANQQLSALSPPAQPVLPTALPTTPSLSNMRVAPQATAAMIAPVTGIAPGQTSFDSSNTPAKYLGSNRPNKIGTDLLAADRPAATSPSTAIRAESQPAANLPPQRLIPAPASSLDNFRGTGIGVGAQGGQIAVSQGADGVPIFSNSDSAQQQAASLGNLPVRAATGPSASDDPNAPLASLGDIGNLGNGRGTFSQAQAGDAALSTGRFNRAADLRQSYADQDRLRAALNANDSANSLTIVRDSSKPLTRNDLAQAQIDQQAQQARTNNISLATANLNGGIDRQGAQQQLRQANRLEDLQVAATGPNATPEAQAALRQAMDPTGEKALARQLTAANINKTNADADEAKAKAAGTDPASRLAQINVTKAQRELDQQPIEQQRALQSQEATFNQALGSVDALLGTKVDPKNPNGPRIDEDPGLEKSLGRVNGLLPTLPASPAADFEARLDTLKAQTFLPQVAALKGTGALSDAEGKKLSDSVGALSTKMSPEAFRKSLQEVRSTLDAAKTRAAKNSSASGVTQPLAPGAPKVGTVQGGYVFLGGDPASPSSWRAQ